MTLSFKKSEKLIDLMYNTKPKIDIYLKKNKIGNYFSYLKSMKKKLFDKNINKEKNALLTIVYDLEAESNFFSLTKEDVTKIKENSGDIFINRTKKSQANLGK